MNLHPSLKRRITKSVVCFLFFQRLSPIGPLGPGSLVTRFISFPSHTHGREANKCGAIIGGLPGNVCIVMFMFIQQDPTCLFSLVLRFGKFRVAGFFWNRVAGGGSFRARRHRMWSTWFFRPSMFRIADACTTASHHKPDVYVI